MILVYCACGSGGGFPDAPKAEPSAPGTFEFAWSLTDSTGASTTCTQANATNVHVTIVQQPSGEQFASSFDCGLATAVSGALFPATYQMSFALLSGTTTLASAPAQTGTIDSGRTTMLAPIVFSTP